MDSEFQRLVRILEEGDWEKRQKVAQLLGEKKNPRAIPYLIQGLKWRSSRARNIAIRALVSIGKPSIRPLLRVLRGVTKGPRLRSAAANCLGLLRAREATEDSIRGLSDPNVSVRLFSLVEVYRLDYRRAAPLIIRMLNDEGEGVRANAAEILGRWKDKKAVTPLMRASGDRKWYVRQLAALALGRTGDKRAEPALRKLSNDQKPAVRRAASDSLKLLD